MKMKKNQIISLIRKSVVTLCLSLFTLFSVAQNYYISPTGNDANAGTQASPWKTLSKATSTVTSGVIKVSAGTYTEAQTINLKAGVSVEGENKTTTILKSTKTGQWSNFINMESSDGTNGNQSISNITIDGSTNTTGNSSGTWVGVAITGRSNVTIHDCIFKNFYAYGVVFQGNHLDGITAKNWTSGPYATGNKFYNNDMTNCSGVLAEIQGGSGCLGIGWQDGMEIYNNSIINTSRPAGKNGWPIKFWSNGYLKGVKIHDNTLIRSPYNSPQVFGGTGEWDFAIEFFNVQGLEIYNNYIQGSVDINYTYKGAYSFGAWIHHNTFNHEVQNPNPESGIILEFKADHVLIENNTFNNKFVGVSYNTRGVTNNGGENNYACNYGASIGGCSGIINNVIRNNVFSNLYPGIGLPGGVIIQSESTDDVQVDGLYIYNNVFSAKPTNGAYNGLDFGGMGAGSNVKNIHIRNNIFQNFRSNPIVKQSGGTQSNVNITNNDFWNNVPNTISWTGATQTNNQTVNPLFVSATDFHLQLASPLIDDGFTPLLLPSYVSSVPFNGTAPDLGAFEGTGVSSPCTSWVFSEWSACGTNGIQTRTVVSSNPNGCVGNPPADSLSRTCTPPPHVNVPPTANAGSDQTLTLPINQTTLNGTGTDPDGTVVSFVWTKISGPSITIVSPNNASTVITDLVQGVYDFELAVTDDSGAVKKDTVRVTVNAAPVTTTVNAGPDETVNITLNLSCTTTGNIASYLWTRVSGPNTPTFTPNNASSTTVTNLRRGTYVFRIRVTNITGQQVTDDKTVTIK